MKRKRKAGTDPTRLRMLEAMSDGGEWTAKELAAELGVGANSLYHHIRVLESAVLVEKAGTRAPGRMVETTYRLTAAPDQRTTWDLDEDLVLTFIALLEAAKADVREAVHEAARRVAAGEKPLWETVLVESPSFITTPADIADFRHRLRALVSEFRDRSKAAAEDSTKVTLKFTYALRERPLRTTRS
ncbi:MAG: ArsR/SmtB family transcription factor [Acidimicrobiia bacterium]